MEPPADAPFGGQKPEIRYPTTWGYRVVGESEELLRELLVELVGEAEHEILVGNESSGGKYVSLNLRLLVEDEAHRLRIYERLRAHEAVRFVI